MNALEMMIDQVFDYTDEEKAAMKPCLIHLACCLVTFSQHPIIHRSRKARPSKLTDDMRARIYQATGSQRQIAERFDVSQSVVSTIKTAGRYAGR